MIELDDPYNEFKAKIEDVAQSASETSKKEFNDGDGCLLKYSCDQTWYRGRVMNKIFERKASYRVHLIDYGNVEIVDQNSIKAIPNEISEDAYPAHACKFFLSGIHPTRNCWSIEAMHAAEKFSVYRSFTVNVISVSKDRVYHIHSPEINAHLQSIDLGRSVTRSEITGFISHLPLDDPLSFYLQPNEHPSGESLQSLSAAINNVYSTTTAPEKLAREFCVPNTYCIALFAKDRFARARVLSVDQTTDMVRILFIDYGNSTTVLRNSLCTIQTQFVDLAPFAVKCRIFNCSLTSSRSSVDVYQHVKEMIGYESPHPKQVHCTVVGPSYLTNDDFLIRCVVLQSHELSSGIRLETRPLAKGWLVRAQGDATTRPRAKSPFAKRLKYLTKINEREVESQQYIKREHIEVFPSNPGIQNGRVCIGKWSVDNKYYRLRFDQENECFRFLDYGNAAILYNDKDTHGGCVEELCRLPDDFRAAPFAICTIPCGSPTQEFLTDLMKNEELFDVTFRRLKPPGNGQMGWLIDIPIWNQSNQKLTDDHVKFVNNRFSVNTTMAGVIRHIDSEQMTVYLTFQEDDFKKEEVQETILRISEEGQLLSLVEEPVELGQIVLAIYPADSELYRARIKSFEEYTGLIEVQFIDFGDRAFVCITDLYFYDCERFMNERPLAYQVHVNGLQAKSLKTNASALYEYFAAAFTGVHISANITEIDKHGEIWVDLAHPNSPFDLLYELFNGYKAVQMLPPQTVSYCLTDVPFETDSPRASISNFTASPEVNNNNQGIYLTQAEDGCYYPVLCEGAESEHALTSPSLPESC
ncbi:Oidioi.mRNA.OKI2018_I69.XSR.g16382.t1.cds [Oikopleura dioica]|uniref:Oidioi.mRNA.OKI2018_I69.XSR.g16382.t1.cds n=1 Tax=Oikopleura dioica TaxID=34765 RepID=A0ABN7SL17_OIKDI|nr:Oidioi.mRNA.OKI2018_I69.XSR.g16382.t1.cds [Oikopleura dioica]